MSEAEAQQKYPGKVQVHRSEFGGLLFSPTPKERTIRTLTKLIVHTETNKVLGCHMVGPDAAEIIQGFAVAIQAGATKADFDRTIAIHPSSAEEFVLMS
jgi:glutathione reductase (NADPH)